MLNKVTRELWIWSESWVPTDQTKIGSLLEKLQLIKSKFKASLWPPEKSGENWWPIPSQDWKSLLHYPLRRKLLQRWKRWMAQTVKSICSYGGLDFPVPMLGGPQPLYNSSCRGSDALVWSPWAPSYIDTCITLLKKSIQREWLKTLVFAFPTRVLQLICMLPCTLPVPPRLWSQLLLSFPASQEGLLPDLLNCKGWRLNRESELRLRHKLCSAFSTTEKAKATMGKTKPMLILHCYIFSSIHI